MKSKLIIICILFTIAGCSHKPQKGIQHRIGSYAINLDSFPTFSRGDSIIGWGDPNLPGIEIPLNTLLRLGESWESDYNIDTTRKIDRQEWYIFYSDGREQKRLSHVILIKDTAFIAPGLADSIFKKAKVINVAGKIFIAK